MARATGYVCDVDGTFGTTPDDRTPPIGWIAVTVIVDPKVGSAAASASTFHVCSDACLRRLAQMRIKAALNDEVMMPNGEVPQAVARGVTPKATRNYSEEGAVKMRQNGLKLQHAKGRHEDNPNPECPDCIAEYESADEEARQ